MKIKLGINVRDFGDVALLALMVTLLVESAVGRPQAMWIAGMHATFVVGMLVGKHVLRRP